MIARVLLLYESRVLAVWRVWRVFHGRTHSAFCCEVCCEQYMNIASFNRALLGSSRTKHGLMLTSISGWLITSQPSTQLFRGRFVCENTLTTLTVFSELG